MQRDWIDYASAIGNLATFATLVFVLYKNYKTRKEVQDLSIIAIELKKQNEKIQEQNHLTKIQLKDQVRPMFRSPITHLDVDGTIKVTLFNEGHRTHVDLIKYDETDLSYNNWHPQVIEHKGSLEIIAKKNGRTTKFVQDCNYCVFIYHSDIFGNKYLTELQGTGNDVQSFGPFDDFDKLE